ncbi:MAG TPA: crossover junction endodeoxyribonuclease RuvC [Acidimicrobiales bacterium]|nr:crossover junction endodeoxyribonuclease RuvC [Acidimicrobiales bacterium]
MFVLGVDPGLSRCGYGAVRAHVGGRLEAVAAGVLRTDTEAPLPRRLSVLMADLKLLLEELRPDAVAVERVFFQTNVRTAMSVGQASGLALALADGMGCDVAEYTANEVKAVVAGYGAATKSQVQRMVQTQLGLAAPPRPPDAADALALALTHCALGPRRARIRIAEGVAP